MNAASPRASGPDRPHDDRAEWLAMLQDNAAEDGSLTPLGIHHWALYTEAGGQLLVTFDTISAARARKGALPHLCEFASVMGWSYLCILADGQTWFRDPAIYAFFDAQIKDDFYDGFDHVLFYGSGMSGYAAAAYSVAAPGASVLTVAPRASMSPARVPFETRDRPARRLDFTVRYGFAPDMLRGARDVWIMRDPFHDADAAQAALFRGHHISTLNLRYMGERAETALEELEILPKLLVAVMNGQMSAGLFAQLWRARRKFGGYLKQLLLRTDTAKRETLSYAICANVARRTRAPRFRKRLEEMNAARAGAVKIPA